MIEVEKKFSLKLGDEEKLINGATFIGEKVFTDIYYDDSEYSLTTKDLWLRSRDNKYELKVPHNESIENRVSDLYEELETEKEIGEYLKLDMTKSFVDALSAKGFAPFCKLTTTRKKYKNKEFNIDVDSMDFGYKIAEIELMLPNESKIHETSKKIIDFAESLGIFEGFVRGKVVEYLNRNNIDHFNALVNAKIIKG